MNTLDVRYNVEAYFTPGKKAMILKDAGVPGFYRAVLQKDKTDMEFFENFRGGEVVMSFQRGVSERGTNGEFVTLSHKGKGVYPV